jgi:SAM-dependent methyltransferase
VQADDHRRVGYGVGVPESEPTGSQGLGSYRFFQDFHQRVDSAVTLFTLAQSLAADAKVIVDVGCGRGALIDPLRSERRLHDLRGPGRTVIGIDVDLVAAENPIIDEFRAIDGPRWPLDDNSVDLAVCDWVLEHVADPTEFVGELHRVLRPGGAFVARTVSKSSLLSVGARMVPNRRHAKVVGTLQPKRLEEDVFPTTYRMNTRADLAAVFGPGFDWAASFHPGLEHYAKRWPPLVKLINAVEPRLPKRTQHALIVTARKRG